MKKGLTKRYIKFGWEFFEMLDWRRQTKIRKNIKNLFLKEPVLMKIEMLKMRY